MQRTKRRLALVLAVVAITTMLAVPAMAGTSAQTTPATPTAQPTDDWASVKAAGKILVGTSADYPPFEFYNSTYQLDGFDIALFKELGKRLGVQVEFNDFAFDGLLDALRLKQVDAAIGAISVTPDRKQIVDFTNLYYIGDSAALVSSTYQGAIRSATDVAKQRIGVQSGTTFQSWAQANLVDEGLITQTDLAPYQDANAMVRDLRNGKLDVVLMGALPAQQFIQQFNDLRIAGEGYNDQQMAIAARAGSTLTERLNQAMLQLQQDGTFARLSQQYLGVAGGQLPPDQGGDQGTPTPQPTPTPGPPPCINGMAYVADLSYDDKNGTAPPSLSPGQNFTKRWRVRNSGTCAWEPNYKLAFVSGDRMGGKDVTVGKRVEPGQTADLAVALTAPTSYGTFRGNWNMRSDAGKLFGEGLYVMIKVPNPNPPPPPPPPPPSNINPNLRADANPINPGQCTAIRWDVDNVSAVYFIDGGNVQGVGGHDSRTVCPGATTTYTLRVAKNDGATQDFPITITVNGPPPGASINFWVDNDHIDAGQCTTLRWDVKNVQAVYVNGQGVTGQGSQQVCPSTTTTYSLTVVRNDGGQEGRQVTVYVNAPPPSSEPSIKSFTTSSNQISAGGCVTLSWNTSNTNSVSLTRGSTTIASGQPANGSFQDCPGPGFYDYVLTALGNGQKSQSLSVNVTG